MIIMNEIVKPRASKLCRFPIPAELIAVLGGTLASYLLDFDTNYNVKLVGHIPLGLVRNFKFKSLLSRILALFFFFLNKINSRSLKCHPLN